MHRIFAAGLSMMLLLVPAAPVLAQQDREIYQQIEQLLGNADSFDQPLRSLVKAMRSGDAETIAGLADYPLKVKANGEEYEIQNEQDFVDNFDTLVMEDTRRAVGHQRYKDLFVNSDGVMLADGAVWMAPVCEDNSCDNAHWAITIINN